MVESAVLVTDKMEKCFNDPGEPIMFQARVTKLSRFNIEQRRTLVLTGDHIYLFDKENLNRRHRVTNMVAFIKSTKTKTDMSQQAIGLIETRGLVSLIEGTDAMLKAANVELSGPEQQGGSALASSLYSSEPLRLPSSASKTSSTAAAASPSRDGSRTSARTQCPWAWSAFTRWRPTAPAPRRHGNARSGRGR